MAEPDCIFCKIVAGELPSAQVHSDDRTIAFMDISPATRGHLLVIPRAHARNLYEVADDDLHHAATAAKRLAITMRDRLGCDGVNLLNSCGPAAWQTVFHFHLHVIPRYQDDPERDPLTLPWVPTPGDPARIAAAAEALRSGTPA